ncbi:hypothetical protein PENTCL1PPCAC_15704, partial [Pristionchus entomophagus]
YTALFIFCDGDAKEPATIVLRDAFSSKYNLTINEGWIVMEYWPNGSFSLRPFLVLVFTDILLLVSFTSAASLSIMTFYHIHANTMVSDNYRKTQRTVLIALCAQTVVPIICVYTPYVTTLNSPFIGVKSIISPEMCASFISSFPLWDAVVIILLMKDYRNGAMSLVFGASKKKSLAISQMFSATTVAPT